MKRLDFFVRVTKAGKPLWRTLQVRFHDVPKKDRKRRTFPRPDTGSPIGRRRQAMT